MRTTPCLVLLGAMLTASLCYGARKDFSIYGKPPLGAFGIDTLEHVEGAAKLGMTLVYSYSSSSARKQLDPNDPMGQAVAAHKMKIMYPLCGRFTQVRLARDITPTDTTIPVTEERPKALAEFPEAGYVVIEGERIEYAHRAADAFEGCQRGAGGTKSGRHGAGLLLCDSEGLRKDILAVKDSPSLWGYWLVDDARDNEADSLKEMARVIHLTDRDAKGRPNNHIIVMGIGGSSAMSNYSPGVCDALGVYPYPYHKGKLDMKTRNQMRYIMARARSDEPEIGLIGVYQAFRDPPAENWVEMPTPEQVREDMLSFYDYGADGLCGFIYHWNGADKTQWGLDSSPEVAAMVGQTDADILAGKVKRVVPPARKFEWFSVLTDADAKLSPGGTPAYDFDDPAKLAALVKQRPNRLSAEPLTVEGRSYPLKVTFPAWDKKDPKSDRWPIAQIASDLFATSDWSKFRYIEQPLYNLSDRTVSVRVSLEDTDRGWWEPAMVHLPPNVPVLLRVPIAETRLCLDPRKVNRWLFWEADPPTKAEFHMGTPMLVPR